MKIHAVLSVLILAVIPAGCASRQATGERGWVGGNILLAKNASLNIFDQGHQTVPAFPHELEHQQKAGVFVSEVYSNTPLARAGMRAGDLILRVNHKPVENLKTFYSIIDRSQPGSTISLTIAHADRTEDRTVTIGRESYKNWRMIGVGLPGKPELDLMPDPDFSLIALGYSRNQQRVQLHSPENEFVSRTEAQNHDNSGFTRREGWMTWLALFHWGRQKQILSQQIVESGYAVLGTTAPLQ